MVSTITLICAIIYLFLELRRLSKAGGSVLKPDFEKVAREYPHRLSWNSTVGKVIYYFVLTVTVIFVLFAVWLFGTAIKPTLAEWWHEILASREENLNIHIVYHYLTFRLA